MTKKVIPIYRYEFQYRYFRYIGIPNIPIAVAVALALSSGNGSSKSLILIQNLIVNRPFPSCATDLVIARLTMHHGIVLGKANKKPVPKNSPVMHCQRRYSPGNFGMAN